MRNAPTITASNRLRFLFRTGLKRASGLRLALLSALALAVTLAATVTPARSAQSAPSVQRLALPAPVGEMVRAYLDAVAPAPQPESSGTPSLETALNPDGSLRGGLSGSFNAEGYAIAYGADGGPRFVPGASLSPMTAGYASFVINTPNNLVRTIAVNGGDLYVGGLFTDLAGIAEAAYVAKWNGTSWSALGGGANGFVYALAVVGTDVYVGGRFTSVLDGGGASVAGTSYIARWDGSAWSALDGGSNGTVQAMVESGGEVYVGGNFTSMHSSDTTPVAGTGYIAKWNTGSSTWSALGGGVNGSVQAIAVSGSDVYAGGNFTAGLNGVEASVVEISRIAKWDGTSWSALGGGVNSTVFAIAVSGTAVYVGGNFSTAFSSEGTLVADTGYIARWDGSVWNALGSGAQQIVLTLAVNGSSVYVGGNFSDAYSSGGPVPGTGYIARWDGSAWSALGSGAQQAVFALAVSGSSVYVGGAFTSVNTNSGTSVTGTSRIAKWDGSAWSAPVSSGNGANNIVQAIAVSGSDVYIGGHFTDLAGIAEANFVAKWNGTSWSALGGGAQNAVFALAVNGSNVHVGGSFSTVYVKTGALVAGTSYIAKWDGSAWSALGGGTSGNVQAIAASGSNVYVGGSFTTAYSIGTTPVANTVRLAQWDGSAWNALGGGAKSTVNALAVSGSDV